MSLSINFIGCGRVGKAIARLISQRSIATIAGIINTSFENSSAAVEFIGQGTPIKSLRELPQADIYFIATRDDSIKSVCTQLTIESKLKPHSIIVHCSGSLTSDILSDAKSVGCYTASIHPIKSFANPELSVKNFSGTYCAFEGDEQALPLLKHLFEGIGGNVFGIVKEHKNLYHASGVIANNYLVTLHYHAVQCYISTGVDEEIAKNIVSMLMNDALTNLKDLEHKKALTGPIQRGDVKTVKKHITSFDNLLIRNIYTALGLGTLPLTTYSSEIKNKFEEILQQSINVYSSNPQKNQ